MSNISEKNVDFINTNVFFKEFTFGFDNLIKDSNNQQVELADNIVWLEDLFMIYQIKERDLTKKSAPFEQWFKSKVLNKAIKQVKNTVKLLNTKKEITLTNNRKHPRVLSNINLSSIIKIVVYDPKENIPENYRFIKFYDSKEINLIHLFHIEDYLWICKYLITPYEVHDYMLFREEFYLNQDKFLNGIPEQYVLGHYLSDKNPDHFEPNYIENLNKLRNDLDSFDLGFYLSQFGDKIRYSDKENDYYFILSEIAKLHRNELKEFKKRFTRIFELSKDFEFYDPYRLTFSTGCGFVFLALPKSLSSNWKDALTNITLGHKYEQKIDKCVGVVIFKELDYFEVFWIYVESPWEYDSEIEIQIKELPLRPLRIKKFREYDL